MERNFDFSVDEFYHIYSRGVDKRIIFDDDNDRDRFVKLLFVCNHSRPIVFRDLQNRSIYKDVFDFPADQSLIDIGAYCLMPNHFHLLLHEKKEGGISAFMQKMLTAYSAYYNKKHNRKGKLYDGEFKAKHLTDDRYLVYIYAYIHLNPVKLIYPNWKEEESILDISKTKNFIGNYHYSSYDDYVGIDRKEAKILSKSAFPGYFDGEDDFQKMLDYWLEFQKEERRKEELEKLESEEEGLT